MKNIFTLAVYLALLSNAWACEDGENNTQMQTNLSGPIVVRDPFILVDKSSKSYYLHSNNIPSFKVYKSRDLLNWEDDGKCFTADTDFWGKNDFWAPDVFYYKGKYYLFASFSSKTSKRGTSILVSSDPKGPFEPLMNNAVTPNNQVCLDGTLYIDDNQKPWIVYSHEWIETIDGEVAAQPLSDDLKQTLGNPVVLFTASKAPWVGPFSASGITGYVTDSPFPFRAANGELLMLWSSFSKSGQYSIGVARSQSGSIAGPWIHDPNPLNNDDGGHAMLFRDFDGRLLISYHSPNRNPEHLTIKEVHENEGKLSISESFRINLRLVQNEDN